MVTGGAKSIRALDRHGCCLRVCRNNLEHEERMPMSIVAVGAPKYVFNVFCLKFQPIDVSGNDMCEHVIRPERDAII